MCAHFIIIVSSISSTPWRNRFAKTGGTERTIDAFTEQNSSFSFPLCALFAEPSTSMGGCEPFRFMTGRASDVCWLGVLALILVGPEFRRMPCLRGGVWRSLYSQSIIHSRAHSSEAQYGMCCVLYLWRTKHTTSPFSSPPRKLLSKSSLRGLRYLGRHCWRQPAKPQKVCLMRGFTFTWLLLGG